MYTCMIIRTLVLWDMIRTPTGKHQLSPINIDSVCKKHEDFPVIFDRG